MQASLERLRQRRDDGAGEGGFTLIELLIVIVILGILAAIVVFAVQNLSSSSAKASCGTDLKTVETAVEAYKAQEGEYPTLGTTAATSSFGIVTAKPATVDGIYALLGTDTGTVAKGDIYPEDGGKGTAGAPFGPWLKDVPFNSGHYEITVSVDGKGTVMVNDTPGSIAPTPATVGASALGTAPTCAGVS